MVNRFLFVFMLFFVPVCAQNEDFTIEYQKLVYAMGIDLAEQDTIVDQESAMQAVINIACENIVVERILGLFLVTDPEMIEHNIQTVQELLDYEFSEHYDVAIAGLIWLATFQDVFMVFIQLHEEDEAVSFQTWADDMAYLETWTDESYFQEDPDYAVLWQACVAMIEAQENFSYEFKLARQ